MERDNYKLGQHAGIIITIYAVRNTLLSVIFPVVSYVWTEQLVQMIRSKANFKGKSSDVLRRRDRQMTKRRLK